MEFRSPELTKKYADFRAAHAAAGTCSLCTGDVLKNYTHWKLMHNDFPYDYLAKIHHMFVSRRHVMEKDLNEEELKELRDIKQQLLTSDYEYILEGTIKKKSIPGHYHIHLIITK